jgi:hypothetical protein
VNVCGVSGQEHGTGSVPGRAAQVDAEVRYPHGVTQPQLVTRAGGDEVLQFVEGDLAVPVVGLTHGEHPPARRCAEREEEQDAGSGQVRVHLARVQPIDFQVR